MKVPVVAFGQPEAVHVLSSTDANEQLGRRFLVREELGPFSIEDEESEKAFGGFLHLFDLALPLADRSGLARRDVRRLIWRATNGRMCYVTDLIKEAAWHAVAERRESIRVGDLAFGFQRAVAPVRADIANPFVD
jgi:hypothetical protein